MAKEYRVSLDNYSGPMDLLLYLIRREEVDIHDIPLAKIIDQYIQYVELLHEVDPNAAGDFLVLAATLTEIKTRMLLPAPEALDGDEDGAGIDPRADLIRQLLEYKEFKDASSDLRDMVDRQSQRFPRRPPRFENSDETQLDLEDVQVWDLFDSFSRVMESIGTRAEKHEVIYDDTPVELHAADILDRLQREGALSFAQIFEGRTVRSEVVGLFLAMLELMKQRQVFASQDANFKDIHIHLNPNPPTPEELLEQDRIVEEHLRKAEQKRLKAKELAAKKAEAARQAKEAAKAAAEQADNEDEDHEEEEEEEEDDDDDDEDDEGDEVNQEIPQDQDAESTENDTGTETSIAGN
ncbi:MAG: segregation/condensation protein A [Phycisphaerae bacterium]|jgi:segregation and condensation protein A|nr:segregation/condensation protein A [Phycisphaerae bacterium]